MNTYSIGRFGTMIKK